MFFMIFVCLSAFCVEPSSTQDSFVTEHENSQRVQTKDSALQKEDPDEYMHFPKRLIGYQLREENNRLKVQLAQEIEKFLLLSAQLAEMKEQKKREEVFYYQSLLNSSRRIFP